jgi:hypothetical protein
VLSTIRERQFVTFFDVVRVILDLTETDFWSLDILEDGDRFAYLFGCCTDPNDLLVTFLVVSMREVKAKAVHTSTD